uniref:BLTX439 n=1 Tax=Nephila pilipes TaxID=299642 RepID=A0A076KTY0_NEPPI|nr:BLTX439 [Nephila pilipes]
MSSADKQGDVSVQRKEDSVPEKEKGQNEGKSDSSPQKKICC